MKILIDQMQRTNSLHLMVLVEFLKIIIQNLLKRELIQVKIIMIIKQPLVLQVIQVR